MRLREFTDDASTDSGLATVLNFLANRTKDSDAPATMSTQSLINMVKNSGSYFDYDALVDAYENDPTVKNLIKDFNKDTLTLKLPGENDVDSETHGDDSDSDSDETSFDDLDNEAGKEDEEDFEQRDTIGDMAKRALKRGR